MSRPYAPILDFDPARRASDLPSTRSISRICAGTDILFLDKRKTATIVALAHSSGWSAERIANNCNEWFGTRFVTAELVWDTYNSWRMNQSWMEQNGRRDEIRDSHEGLMLILRQHEIVPTGKKLSQTRPVS
jgi:hypothetical protein